MDIVQEKISILVSYGLDEEMLTICREILGKSKSDISECFACEMVRRICNLHIELLSISSLLVRLRIKADIYKKLNLLAKDLSNDLGRELR